MSDDYTGFSAWIPLEKKRQREWAVALTEMVRRIDNDETHFDDDETCDEEMLEIAKVCWQNNSVPDCDIEVGDGAGQSGVYLSTSEHGCVDTACNIIQAVMRQFDVAGVVVFEWSNYTDRGMGGDYSGGACAVSKEAIAHMHTGTVCQHLEAEVRRFQRSGKPPLKLGESIR